MVVEWSNTSYLLAGNNQFNLKDLFLGAENDHVINATEKEGQIPLTLPCSFLTVLEENLGCERPLQLKNYINTVGPGINASNLNLHVNVVSVA